MPIKSSSSSSIASLSSHIAKLRKEEPTLAEESILFWGDAYQKSYLPHLKPCVGSYTCHVRLEAPTTLVEVLTVCKSKRLNKVITCSVPLLKLLLHWTEKKAPSMSSYTGSLFKHKGIEFVIIPPIEHLCTVNHAPFLTTRLISKFTKKESWYIPTEFSWNKLTGANQNEVFHKFLDAFLICIDIETIRKDAQISCLSYTAFFYTDTGITSDSYCLVIDSLFAVSVMRRFNWDLKAPKVLQNGKYDAAYLCRYSAPMYNYLYDTANMFHAWYSELPKDLGFLNAFFIREAYYWKDLSDTEDLEEYYRYNCLDTWGTGNALLAMLMEIPDWAVDNYLLEFPLTFPCHLAEMTGIKRDTDRLHTARVNSETLILEKTKTLNTILDIPKVSTFNVKSPNNIKDLLNLLGCKDIKSGDDKSLRKAKFRHPLNAKVLNLVSDIKSARTLKEKYLQVGEDSKEFNGRTLYALNPHGTDSSRLASREHHFWCGLQVQNIPQGPSVKSTFVADDGFYMAEADLEQAESRDTAYISGDMALIQAVEHSPDFHSANASAFFGVPFEQIFDEATHTVLNKPLRTLAKPVNHGANYNMGAFILVETMGEENIIKARNLLNLPKFWSYIQVAQHLLDQFHITYPGIRGVFYKGVVEEILLTCKLTSTAIHISSEEKKVNPKGWTRYCFGRPDKNKQDLNSYISHPPQSLNAQTLNKAFLLVFYKIAMHPEHGKNIKLLAQIHDSILFQYRIGCEYICDMVKDLMEIPVKVVAYDGVERTFTVPASIKKGIKGAPARYWSETE